MMAWVKSDDREDLRKDIRRAWRRDPGAVGLRAMVRTHCARMETDGLVDLDHLEELVADPETRERLVTVLVDTGLLELLPAGEKRRVRVREVTVQYGPIDTDAWVVPDYLDHNEAKVESEARRAEEAAKKREQRERARRAALHRDGQGSPESVRLDTAGTAAGLRTVSEPPDPTRPDPTESRPNPDPLEGPPDPPQGGRSRDREKWKKEMAAWVAAHPVTSELSEILEPVVKSVSERVGDSEAAIWLSSLHAHSADGVLVIGAPSSRAGWVWDRFGKALQEAAGMPVRVIDCGCEQAIEQAA